MIMPTLKRKSQGKRYSPDPFYQTKTWKQTRKAFIESAPHIQLPALNGVTYSNKYCVECWKQGKLNSERIEIDHIRAIRDDGNKTDFTNLRSLCHSHHSARSAEQKNQKYKK
jgi:hypothetical protein